MVDALSRRHHLLVVMSHGLVGFKKIKREYTNNPYFGSIYTILTSMHLFEDFFLLDGILFKRSQLCIPLDLRRKNLVQEMHSSRLGGHFGRKIKFGLVSEIFLA